MQAIEPNWISLLWFAGLATVATWSADRGGDVSAPGGGGARGTARGWWWGLPAPGRGAG